MTNNNFDHSKLTQMANSLRFLSVDMVNAANSGHPGAPLGMADIVTVLFNNFMNFNPQDANWYNRDRFILSNGHSSALLYSLLHLTGYNLSIDDLKKFRQLGSKTAGHPEFGYADGIETTTGPLGQGFANAVGMALAQEIMAERFAPDLFNNKTYVTVGDGCLMEGISHEAAELAGHLNLKNLVVIFDDNGISIDGSTSLSSSTDVLTRFESYGFNVLTANGHDYDEIYAAFLKAKHSDRPTFIAFNTKIGFGSNKEGTSAVHGSPLKDDAIAEMRINLNYNAKPFEVSTEIKNLWLHAVEHGSRNYSSWQTRFNADSKATEIHQYFTKSLCENSVKKLNELKKEFSKNTESLATRVASGKCIESIAQLAPNFISGSADLTPSNNTKAKSAHIIGREHFEGSYIHYGVREHAMGAVMNGLALYGAFIPAGGTFLSFADYMREPMRLAAMMHQKVIFIMTHDSIGLGEDGPTHQPVEHLAMLRATPMLNTFRPADLVETLECWQYALSNNSASVLALSRQGVPQVRTKHTNENLCAKGAYILKETKNPKVILIATGTEVSLAVEAHEQLLKEGINSNVVSMPCMELFNNQTKEYKMSVIPCETPKIAIEAACEFGWHKYIGAHGTFIGVNSFGESAPASKIYDKFGITVQNIVEKATKLAK